MRMEGDDLEWRLLQLKEELKRTEQDRARIIEHIRFLEAQRCRQSSNKNHVLQEEKSGQRNTSAAIPLFPFHK